MNDQYGILGLSPRERLGQIENRLEQLVAVGAKNPAQKGAIARLMAERDEIIAKQAARKGAQMAAGSIPGVAGGLASSGIRGMDVVEHEFTPEVIRQNNVEGANQGLRQFSVAPPGSGRLVNISFVSNVSSPVPVTAVVGGASAIGATTSLSTVSVNWAILRIVGLVTQYSVSAATTFGVMQDFKIGGSPNLFLYETWVSMDDYDTDKEQFAGLRAYPVLIAPNTASVDIAAWSSSSASAYCLLSVVTEVLRDDAFGPGLPAAYAR